MNNMIDREFDKLKAEGNAAIDKAVDDAFRPVFWLSTCAGVVWALLLLWAFSR
jgi:hypothetical protein